MRLALALGLLAIAAAAHAGQVPQQRGLPCAATWILGSLDAVPGTASRDPWGAECVDGDPFCDLDGAADGACTAEVRVCVEQPLPDCTPKRVRRLRLDKKTRALLPDLARPALDAGPACGAAARLTVPAGASAPTRLGFTSRSGRKAGRSRVAITCLANPEPGAACVARGAGVPSRATFVWNLAEAGSDVDVGPSGEHHNFPFPSSVGLDVCLRCDGDDATCAGVAPATARFSAPIPLFSNGVPVCIDPRLARPPTATIDLATGATTLDVALAADVFGLQPGNAICPRCSGQGTIGSTGTCQAGRRAGEPCTVDALVDVIGSAGDPRYQLSRDCPPGGGPGVDERAGTIALPLSFTTGAERLDGALACAGQAFDDACAGTCDVDCSATPAPKGGINQTCCSNDPILPCFPSGDDANRAIVRSGTAMPPAAADGAWPRTVRGVLAHVGCFPETQDVTVNILAGLPGPTAWLLPFDLTVHAD